MTHERLDLVICVVPLLLLRLVAIAFDSIRFLWSASCLHEHALLPACRIPTGLQDSHNNPSGGAAPNCIMMHSSMHQAWSTELLMLVHVLRIFGSVNVTMRAAVQTLSGLPAAFAGVDALD